jgi:hypothetical protein
MRVFESSECVFGKRVFKVIEERGGETCSGSGRGEFEERGWGKDGW